MIITIDKPVLNKMTCEPVRPAVEQSKETHESHPSHCGCEHHVHKSLLSLGTLNTNAAVAVQETLVEDVQTDTPTEHVHNKDCNHHHDAEQVSDKAEEHVHGPNCNHNHHEPTSKSLFPLEERIKGLNTNKTVKELLTMLSNLTPAMAVSEIAGVFHVNSMIASPLAVSSMHLTNRGTNKEHLPKLFLTALSSLGIISAQKFVDLPRFFIRPFMALAVFFIERNGKVENKSHKEKFDFNVSKSDWINLLKLQGQINTVPWLANLFTGKLKELNEETTGFINKALGKVGISTLHITGLSLGFVGLGHLIDKSLKEFKVVSDKESIAMRAEGAVCACCGAPVCVAEAASEAGAMSLAA